MTILRWMASVDLKPTYPCTIDTILRSDHHALYVQEHRFAGLSAYVLRPHRLNVRRLFHLLRRDRWRVDPSSVAARASQSRQEHDAGGPDGSVVDSLRVPRENGSKPGEMLSTFRVPSDYYSRQRLGHTKYTHNTPIVTTVVNPPSYYELASRNNLVQSLRHDFRIDRIGRLAVCSREYQQNQRPNFGYIEQVHSRHVQEKTNSNQRYGNFLRVRHSPWNFQGYQPTVPPSRRTERSSRKQTAHARAVVVGVNGWMQRH